VPILSAFITEKTASLSAQQKVTALDTLVERFHVMEHPTTDILDIHLQRELAEEFGCRADVVVPDSKVDDGLQGMPVADHQASVTCGAVQYNRLMQTLPKA
jgi:hypothetical protein